MTLSSRFLAPLLICALLALAGVAHGGEVISGPDHLLAPPEEAEDSSFGISLSLSGRNALIGAYRTELAGHPVDHGAVYALRKTGLGWGEPVRILPADLGRSSEFGRSLSVDGKTAFIASPGLDSFLFCDIFLNFCEFQQGQGGFYIFESVGGDWVERKVIRPDRGEGPNFGSLVQLSGKRAVVSAPASDRPDRTNGGAAYVYEFDGSDWIEMDRLHPFGDETVLDFSARAVAISGDTVAVSAQLEAGREGNATFLAGAVYVFERQESGWMDKQFLTGSDTVRTDRFGDSISIDGDQMLIGARRAAKAYFFERIGGEWVEVQKVEVPPENHGAGFAEVVALSDDTAVIGSRFTNSAFVYKRVNSVWELQRVLSNPDSVWFGISLAVTSQDLLIGGELSTVNDVHRSGEAFAYRVKPACSDGLDNDGDGATDHPADSGCPNAGFDEEEPECRDGIDNDLDGSIDLADDGCLFTYDIVEGDPGCGLGGLFISLPLLLASRYGHHRRPGDS